MNFKSLASATAILLPLILLVDRSLNQPSVMASHAGGASAISIDMNPDSSPANTATSLGTRETCARISVNGVQDADEDTVDSVNLDVTISQVPSSNGMIGYAFYVAYDEASLTVIGHQTGFLLGQNTGSSTLDASQGTPDATVDGFWSGAEIDTSVGASTPESGSGVLQRLTIGTEPTAATGVYDLTLLGSAHIDEQNNDLVADSLESARLAVNIACPPTDTDGDRVYDADEVQCGSDPYSAASRPERIDGVFAGVSDDGDGQIDEALPTNIPMADCDGDGFTGTAESFVYSPSTQGDQDPCGTAPSTAPFNVPIGWPADLKGGGIPNSTNKINVLDLTSFTAPVRHLDTSPGDPGYDPRWDVVPGSSGQAKDINSADYNYVLYFTPAMLNSVRAYSGPPCPWAP
ncbi:MAG TPA: cohesin domain-containing protein [Dehalococcoidia bacterium]|nr:cohesin domain-containing protein [Dehalococcoidia bacterium]